MNFQKNRDLWLQRTGGAIQRDKNFIENMERKINSKIPFYFVENHNNKNFRFNKFTINRCIIECRHTKKIKKRYSRGNNSWCYKYSSWAIT